MIRFAKYSTFLFIINLTFFISSCEKELIGPEEYIEIEVSKGTNPEISWNVGPIHKITITKNDSLIWAIYTPNKDAIYSPIKYDQLPQNALLFTEGTIDTISFGKPLILNEKYYIVAMKYTKDSIGGRDFIVREE
ncbi:MAG: hypothetical protein K8R74_00360 [Bacteroidales bacterium]|nr:hypothetical protein [Bacteroidales bacterium]